MAYQLTCVLSAPLLQLPAFHAELVVRRITSFHFPDVIGIHVACPPLPGLGLGMCNPET